MSSVRLAALLTICVLAGFAAAEDDGYRAFKDTDVMIRLPAGFVPATAFHGFQHPTMGSSFVLKTWNLPWAEKVAPFTREAFAATGRTMLGRETVEVAGRKGYLWELSLRRQGYDYKEWYLILDDGARTVGVTGIYPLLHQAVMSDKMKEAVLGLRIGKPKVYDPFAELPFTFTPVAPFALANRQKGSLLYTEKGVVSGEDPGAPVFAIGSGTAKVKARDRRGFAFKRLKATTRIQRPKTEKRAELTVAGLPAVEIVAKANDKQSDLPVVVYQLIVFDEGKYYAARGIAGAAKHAAAVEKFRAMARSLSRKP
jgi:hypothetical protein